MKFTILLVIGGAIMMTPPCECDNVRRKKNTRSIDRTAQGGMPSENYIQPQNIFAARAAQDITIPDWGFPYGPGGQAGVDFMYGGVNWEFGSDGAVGGQGLSYYLRAFDMFPNTYAQELGWGQWIGPGGENPADGPCPLNPRQIACFGIDDGQSYPWSDDRGNPANFEEEFRDCTWPEGDDRLLQCKLDACAFTDGYPIWGTFEGGMGYWPYMTEAKGVKWMVPASVSGYYSKFGTAFVNDFHQPCTNLGGAIQIANNILLAPDAYSFEPNDDGKVDGMVGYMLQRTPIGKMHPDDNRNFWTVVVDTENFAGPLVYSSPYHWEHPNSWRPEIKTWADPGVNIGGATEGTEGSVATTGIEKDGFFYFRMQDVEFPLNDNEDAITTTTGHVKYMTDWAYEVLEPILDGTRIDARPADVRAASRAARSKPPCVFRDESQETLGQFVISVAEGDHNIDDFPIVAYTVSGWGIGDSRISEDHQDAEDNWCHSRMPIDTSNPNLTCNNGKCRLTPYFRLPADGSSATGELIPENELASDIKSALDTRAEEVWEPVARQNNGDYLDGPDAHQEACFDNPGPADQTLYCKRTTDERWLAYRWYRFVDQPEFNQVIGSLPEDEQEETKCFMQARIERLHEMQSKEQSPSWFEPPAGLPTNKVKIDQGFIVSPPLGMKFGYVPVSVYSKLREKPDDCDVVVGDYESEPNPVPSDYFSDDLWGSGYQRYPETCAPTDFSGDTYTVPGVLYFSKRDGSGEKYAYRVPMRDEVSNFVPKAYAASQCAKGPGGSTGSDPVESVDDDLLLDSRFTRRPRIPLIKPTG